MHTLTERLLNDYQRDFPLQPQPFAHIARSLNTSTEAVLQTLQALRADGAVSRVGAVFRPNTVGASTLAAMAVPAHALEDTAALVSAFPQVNHNYEREHRYNLWFVVTASDRQVLARALKDIEQRTGYPVLALPLVRDYHIDLGFRMQLGAHAAAVACAGQRAVAQAPAAPPCSEDFIEAIQDGLPLVARPYLAVAERLGWSEDSVIGRLREMIDTGVIKRLGVVVRHHELGYRANAMVVWDIPDDQVDRVGRVLGGQDCVTLCYQRPRRLPDWPYNLFCMVHGRDRDEVLACIEDMAEGLGLDAFAHAVLFSKRRFKQCGARYRERQ